MEIENMKTVTVKADEYTNSIDLFVEFEVDEVILRYVTFVNPGPGGGAGPNGANMTLVNTSLINEHTLFAFPIASTFFESTNTPFKISNKIVRGTYSFSLVDADTNEESTVSSITIVMVLLFVKYKKKLLSV